MLTRQVRGLITAGADETSELGVQRFIKISSRQKYLYKSFFSIMPLHFCYNLPSSASHLPFFLCVVDIGEYMLFLYTMYFFFSFYN